MRDLRGKRVAATRGTDPWFFLLRSLRPTGLQPGDVELVDLQHPDGRTALERGQVDAWAGLDPHMAASQLDAGSRLLYRNVAFNTWGALNAREDFLAQHPTSRTIVLQQYERARTYASKHVDETATLLADASNARARASPTSSCANARRIRGTARRARTITTRSRRSSPLIRDDKLAQPGRGPRRRAVAALVDTPPATTALRG